MAYALFANIAPDGATYLIHDNYIAPPNDISFIVYRNRLAYHNRLTYHLKHNNNYNTCVLWCYNNTITKNYSRHYFIMRVTKILPHVLLTFFDFGSSHRSHSPLYLFLWQLSERQSLPWLTTIQRQKDRYNADNVVIGGGVALTLSLTVAMVLALALTLYFTWLWEGVRLLGRFFGQKIC